MCSFFICLKVKHYECRWDIRCAGINYSRFIVGNKIMTIPSSGKNAQ